MAQDGNINLNEVKASYSIEDIILVDLRELSLINEFRLYYEISFAVGLMILGSILGNFEIERLITSLVFIIFGVYNLCRYVFKSNKIKKRNSKKNISPESGC